MRTTSSRYPRKAGSSRKVIAQSPEFLSSSLANGFTFASVVTCSAIALSGISAQVEADAMSNDLQSMGVAEAGMTRILSKLTVRENRALLTANFDRQDQSRFGQNSGINQWTVAGVSSCEASHTVGASQSLPVEVTEGKVANGSYRLVSYHYDQATSQGTFVVEGKVNGAVSRIEVTRDIEMRTINNSACPKIARNLRDSVASGMAS